MNVKVLALMLCTLGACTDAAEVLTTEHRDGGTPDAALVVKPGLRGEWHRSPTLSDFAGVWIDPSLDFPNNGLYDVASRRAGTLSFSVRWTGDIFLRAGERTLTLTALDGARLWIDGRLLIDLWDGARSIASGLLDVPEDGWYDLRVEYFHASNADASLRLFVSTAQASVPVPAEDYRHQ